MRPRLKMKPPLLVWLNEIIIKFFSAREIGSEYHRKASRNLLRSRSRFRCGEHTGKGHENESNYSFTIK